MDHFFRKGDLATASVARRFVVPALGDVAAFLQDERVTRMYGREETHEFWVRISGAIRKYGMFSVPTRFTLGEARAIALDLDEVATRGSPMADRQTAVVASIDGSMARGLC